MKYFKYACTLLALFTSHRASSQAPFTTDRDVANMGEIMYQTPTKVTFKIKNTGTEPLLLTAVTPSCGCTTVDWPKSPIAPGSESSITAIYDAKMLGVFQKDIEVITSAQKEPIYLHFQGRVVTKLSDYSGNFPIDLGDVRLNCNNIEFDDVNRGDKPIAELQVVNMGRKNYTPQLMHLPPYLSAQYYPEVLNGGRIGKILLTLDSEKLNNLGLNQTTIYLSRKMGDRVSEENEIEVSALLLPEFSQLSSRNQDYAPRLTLSADSIDLGSMERKKKKSMTLKVTNTGKTKLEIHALQVFNKALTVSLSDRTIDPGETAKLKVTVWAQYLKKAKSNPRVLLITNDPLQSKKVIRVKVKP